MTASMIPLPPRIAICARCGGHFSPRARTHLTCPTCYWWHRALRAPAIADRAFRELRARGSR
jgi:hypothetical protein